jgi:hypothetical protein
MKMKKPTFENGQSLVIVALALIAFIAMLALVLDGANAYAAKRLAQNAADAGALAGATYMCKNFDQANVLSNTIDTGNKYAVTNGAVDPAIVVPNLDEASVSVTATVTRTTYFAGVIGFPQVSPVAYAKAECRNPGIGVLPVAWSCRATAEGGVIPPGENCEMEMNPTSPYDPDTLYILMDSVKVRKEKLHDPACDPDKVDPLPPECLMDTSDIVCYDEYTQAQMDAKNCTVPVDYVGEKIDCDIDNDCIDELKTGGARAWLDLDGAPGGGASELRDWITDPSSVPVIWPHYWLPSEVSVTTSVFKAATTLVGKDVTLPVFNNLCDTGAPDIYYQLTPQQIKDKYEPQEACTYTQLDYTDIAGSSVNYHIYSFTAFHVTCVQTGKNRNTQVFPEAAAAADNVKGWCNGHYAAVENGSIDDNDKTIEGYFTTLDSGGYSGPGGWINTGVFTVVLSK